jgi:hypothetical protein
MWCYSVENRGIGYWLEWMEELLLAKAKHKNLKHINLMYVSKMKVPMASVLAGLDPTTDADKKKIDLARSNEDANSELIMSIDRKMIACMVAFCIVALTNAVDYPDGYAPIVCQILKVKYQWDTGA